MSAEKGGHECQQKVIMSETMSAREGDHECDYESHRRV